MSGHGDPSGGPGPAADRRVGAGPLAGVTVVELATVITGPYAGMLLADLGADVVKVEAPAGDGFRGWDGSGATSVRPAFAAYNRGKRSIAIDLKTDDGRAVLHRLAAEADAVVENFRPGVADRLGIGYEDLRAVNPAVVYCSITGLGSVGPERDRPTYDAVAQAMSGLWSQLADLTDPDPVGPPMSDQLTGMYAALAVLAAVTGARRTGEGQHLEVSMLASTLAFQGLAVATYRSDGVVPRRRTRAETSQSYGFVASDGLPFAVHLSTPHKFWVGLCATVGAPELAQDPRFGTKGDRIRHYEELKRTLAARFATGTREHWLAELARHDVPAAPILDLAEAVTHPQVVASGLLAPHDDPRHDLAPVRSPVRVGGRALAAALPAPALSEHADELLTELGLDADRIAGLRGTGVVV